MKKIAIVTDSNSGISVNQKDFENLFVIPMPFIVDEKEYFEEQTLSRDEFYTFLESDSKISTSQPSPAQVMDIWDSVLKKYDIVLHIPMSSKLSESCNTAKALAQNYEGKVVVVDNKAIAISLKSAVYDALAFIEDGKEAEEIKNILESRELDSHIYLTVKTLSYLRKGGRITAAAAMLGKLLNIKPVLQIHAGKIDAFAKTLSVNASKQKMVNALKQNLDNEFKSYHENGEMILAIAHSKNIDEANKAKQDLEKQFPDLKVKLVDELSFSVACHTGPGVLGLALIRRHKNSKL